MYDLAIAVGINMAESQVKKFNTKHHTFLTKRFDITNKQERIHFVSADSLSFDLATGVAKHFRIKKTDAEKIVKEIKEVVNSWRNVASKYDISRGEQDEMATAFRI